MPLEVSENGASRETPHRLNSLERLLPSILCGDSPLRASLKLVFSKPDEAERRNNSELARSGEMSVNRPENETIANLKNLRVLCLFQPDSEYAEHEGGEFGYQRTLNYYLDNLIRKLSGPNHFTIFIQGQDGNLEERRLYSKGEKVFMDDEEIYPHLHEGRWRLPQPLLENAVAYKVVEKEITYMGIRPCLNNQKLRRMIASVKGEDEDIPMLHYRGHNGYGSGANIPEDILDPAMVYLGGCKSGRFLKKAQTHHYRSGIVALNHSTGWLINHHRARSIMKALVDLRKEFGTNITWGQLSAYLRTMKDRPERFRKTTMILPGDPRELSKLFSNDDNHFSSGEEKILSGYSSKFEMHSDQNVRNRTWEHRLVDHELFIESLLSPETSELQVSTAFNRSGVNFATQRPALRALKAKFVPKGGKVVFFDIGPGIANVDASIGRSLGKPAITSQEIADRFSNIDVMALDMPSEVDVFMGKTRVVSAAGRFAVPTIERDIALSKPNLHIVSGDGLESLKAQFEDSSTNPVKTKSRPLIGSNTPIVIRAANSIDIYANWNSPNGHSPSLRDAIVNMAKDFKTNPVILLYNKEIIFKEAGSEKWKIVGSVSKKGFSHDYRHVSRGGEAPFRLDKWQTPIGETAPSDGNIDSERVRFADQNTPPPQNLTAVNGVSQEGKIQKVYLDRGALRSFVRDLKNPAEKEGIHLHIRTGYRSFEFQESLMKGSPENAETPGFSEHHLGTAIDVTGITRESEAFLFLLKNGVKTGWIPSQYFPPVAISKEPWHWRYVGIAEAKKFYKLFEAEISAEMIFLSSLKAKNSLRKNPNLV